MRNKFNNLLTYIYDYSEKTYRKDTINILFKSILEPLISNQKVEACAFLRIFDKNEKMSSLKRLEFSGVKIYNFSESENTCEKENIWDDLEFLVILGGRYSAALIWDYSDSNIKDSSRICLLYNSRIVLDIAKIITDNSIDTVKDELKEILKKFIPDRRENKILNNSIQNIASVLNDKNDELLFNELENKDETLKTAQIINDKAKFITHEIKNYLSIINLYSTITKKHLNNITADDETFNSIKTSLENISNSSENISYLISELRCLSSVYKTNISMKELINNSIELVKAKVDREGINIKIKNFGDIICFTDKVKVECAITNIIFNAIDAKAKNIIIETNKNNILIKNDGDEIPKNLQERIFEENFSTKPKGNGLGLAFCKKELQNADGDINFISSDNKQTIFQITI